MSYTASLPYILKWKLRKLSRLLWPVRERDSSCGIQGVSNFNRILDNTAREEYQEAIDMLFKLAPRIMARKIPEANIQQAFVFDSIRKLASTIPSPRILCIGCYEDSTAESLEKLGYRIEGIDPILNYDLDSFIRSSSTKTDYYDIIFSTSVIEHVENDELFVKQISELLVPGGTAILTCDYNDQYKPGDTIPQEDFRMYTQKDLMERLLPLLNNCSLVDAPQWKCLEPDFVYAGYRYTFATFVFRKN